MGQVTATFNGRSYRLFCADGEERRLMELLDDVRRRFDRIRDQVGHVGDERVMLMVAVSLADELAELRVAEQQAVDAQASGPAEAASDAGAGGAMEAAFLSPFAPGGPMAALGMANLAATRAEPVDIAGQMKPAQSVAAEANGHAAEDGFPKELATIISQATARIEALNHQLAKVQSDIK